MSDSVKTVVLASLVALVVSLAVSMMLGGSTVVERVVVGSAPEQTNFNAITVDEFVQGGGVLEVTPTDGTTTLTEDQMLNYSVIVNTASTTSGTQTWTLPATSTLTSLLPEAGQFRTWLIKNENTVAATTTTIAAGTGIVLDEPDGQNVVIGGGARAWITCVRDDNTDVICSVDENIDAD